jgi:hypothetical protein
MWWGLSGPYNELIAAAAQPIVRTFERRPATRLHATEGNIVIERRDFARGAPRPALAAGNLTANIILLAALFATNTRARSKENLSAFALACLCLFVVHVLAVVVNVHSIYALDFGQWSEQNYGRVSRTLWEGATHFYTIAGAFGSAIALWWVLSPRRLFFAA